jgi:tetratricopeptide (TPR) repeat protein
MIRRINAYSVFILLAACTLFGATTAADSDYQQGVKALSSHDYTAAVHFFELAVSGDPDNVRFASEYRQAVIHNKEFDRSLRLFEKLAAEHPRSANVRLNFGFAYVDKIPAAGAITQVILANNALTEFTNAVQLEPSWINYYTRGMSYLFWPKIFNRTQFGIADLKKALRMQKSGPSHSYYVRTYIGLGDGYWKIGNPEKARSVWREGLKAFPDSETLKARLDQTDDQIKAAIDDAFDPNKRVDTDLRELWADSGK